VDRTAEITDEPFLTELAGGPLDGSRWIFNHSDDVPTMEPGTFWIARPEPRTSPLPDVIPVDGHAGAYRKETESQVPERLSHVVRGAFYVWDDGEVACG
jgi:hypothetical protein